MPPKSRAGSEGGRLGVHPAPGRHRLRLRPGDYLLRGAKNSDYDSGQFGALLTIRGRVHYASDSIGFNESKRHKVLLTLIYGRAPRCPLRRRDHCTGVCIGCAPGTHRVCAGYAPGMHRGTHQVITRSVKLGQGWFGARPYGA